MRRRIKIDTKDEDIIMSNLSDDSFTGTIIGMILGLPIFVGLAILAIPLVIISCITGVSMGILLQNLAIFAIAVLLIGLFSRFQIIENGIVGLIVGALVHTYFKWHSLVCILIGVAIVGLLFFISYIKIGFWIKTILFSVIITFLVFMCIYSDMGLFPMSDKIWKTAFVIIFFLENILIRCGVAYDNGFLSDEYDDHKKEEYHYDVRQAGSTAASFNQNVDASNNSRSDEINIKRKHWPDNQAEDTRVGTYSEETDEDLDYLMDRVYLFSQRKSFWDGTVEGNIEEKIYQTLKLFIDDDYIILPHVAFREIFWWGKWKDDWRLTNRVTKMHFDFGIFNKDLQPIFFLEIHGKDHKEDPKVMERDKFKAEVIQHCDMKLITMDCSEPMTDQEIREKLIARIKKEVPDRQFYPAYCPRCRSLGKNNLMNITPRKDGSGYFYGCSTYSADNPDKCPGMSIADIPPLYIGIPIVKGNK